MKTPRTVLWCRRPNRSIAARSSEQSNARVSSRPSSPGMRSSPVRWAVGEEVEILAAEDLRQGGGGEEESAAHGGVSQRSRSGLKAPSVTTQ